MIAAAAKLFAQIRGVRIRRHGEVLFERLGTEPAESFHRKMDHKQRAAENSMALIDRRNNAR
ncbi:MAG TPA: hypothetical protein VHK01_03595 [Lacipirellulaceae bacterium]|jgi:hypothetical protein|nr:hypothetical protein [Lacipirellulaceae bacterium]